MNIDWNSAYIRFLRKNALRKDAVGAQKHHIVPKSHGGMKSRKNIVVLTRRNHVVAHILFALGEKQAGREFMDYGAAYDLRREADNILKAYPPLLRIKVLIENEGSQKILRAKRMTVTEFAMAEISHYKLEPSFKNPFILKTILNTIRDGKTFGVRTRLD